jgi:hypothetical protein
MTFDLFRAKPERRLFLGHGRAAAIMADTHPKKKH